MSDRVHSISKRLSLQLATMTVAGLSLLSTTVYCSVARLIHNKQATNEASTRRIIEDIVQGSAAKGGEREVILKSQFFAPRRPGSRLVMERADGSTLHRDADEPPFVLSEHVHRLSFVIEAPQISGGVVHADLAIDVADDVRILQGLVLILAVATLVGGVLAYLATMWRVRAGMAPLRDIVRQTQQISPKRLDQRLRLTAPVAELTPWIDQFNDLMTRLEFAYQQLEGFNADVAHELRTPLATLMCETEVALSRERSPELLRETLVSNLEELQRLSAIVNDMLFLSTANHGAQARRGQETSLAELARQVVEFHDAALAERNLRVVVAGDAVIPVDEPLFKRAVSNLLGNAVRFADSGSDIVVQVDAEQSDQVRILVQNRGVEIEPAQLPRLFDRFFRGDTARSDGHGHHGLGLSIVAAIQGDAMQVHQPPVTRGKDGHGAVAMQCATCHGEKNFAATTTVSIPGHENWHQAPIEMAWEGRSLREICVQLKDRKRNGGKSMKQMVDHMANDSLVGWGWQPGVGRTPAPGTQKQLGELIQAWVDSGAHCPS